MTPGIVRGMASMIISGKWDDLVKSHDLHGHTVRVIVLDQQGSENPWIRSLRAWADSHKPLGHGVDDSRIRTTTLSRIAS